MAWLFHSAMPSLFPITSCVPRSDLLQGLQIRMHSTLQQSAGRSSVHGQQCPTHAKAVPFLHGDARSAMICSALGLSASAYAARMHA